MKFKILFFTILSFSFIVTTNLNAKKIITGNEEKFLKAISLYIQGNQFSLKKAKLISKELLLGKKILSDYYSLSAKIDLAINAIRYGNSYAPDSENKITLANARKAYKLNKKNYSALSTLADVYLYTGKFKQARTYAKQALKLFPGDTESLVILSFSYPGKMEDFLKPTTQRGYYFSKLLKLEGVSPYTLSDIAKIYLENGQFRKALHFFLRAKKQFNKRVSLSFYLGLCYWNTGKKNKAITLWQKSLKFKGENNLKGKIKNLLHEAGINIQ